MPGALGPRLLRGYDVGLAGGRRGKVHEAPGRHKYLSLSLVAGPFPFQLPAQIEAYGLTLECSSWLGESKTKTDGLFHGRWEGEGSDECGNNRRPRDGEALVSAVGGFSLAEKGLGNAASPPPPPTLNILTLTPRLDVRKKSVNMIVRRNILREVALIYFFKY
jgi:hypothetical protein